MRFIFILLLFPVFAFAQADADKQVVATPTGAAAYSLLNLRNYYQTGSWRFGGQSLTGLGVLGSTNANNLVFRTNNIDRVTVLSTGNVGINTTTPTTTLDVNGPGSFYRQTGSTLTLRSDFAQSRLSFSDGVEHGAIYYDGYYNLRFLSKTTVSPLAQFMAFTPNYDIEFGLNGIISNTRRSNFNDIFIGRGVKGVYGSDAYAFSKTSGNGGYSGIELRFDGFGGIMNGNGAIKLDSIFTPKFALYWDNANNIGFGTTSPTNRLHASGTNPIRAEGLVTANSATDFLLTADATGVVRQRTVANLQAQQYATGATAPANTDLIWRNPNISVNAGETTDYVYQQGVWRPAKPLTLYDFGAKPYPYNSQAAIQKAANLRGVIIVPDTVFTSLTPITIYSNTTLKGGSRDKSWIASNFFVGDSTVQNNNISFQDISIGLPTINGWGDANKYAVSVRNVFHFNYINGFVKGCNGGGIEFKDKGFVSTNYKIVNVDMSFNFKGEIFYNAPTITPTGTNYFTDMVFVNCKVNTGAYSNYAIVVDVKGSLNFTTVFTNVYVDFLNRYGILLRQNAVIKGDNLTLDNTGSTEGIVLAYTPTVNVNRLYSNIVKGQISLPVGIWIATTNTSVSNSYTNNFVGTPFLDNPVTNKINFTNYDDATLTGNVTDFTRLIYGISAGVQYASGSGREHRFDNMIRANTDYVAFRAKNNTGGKTLDIAVRTDGTADLLIDQTGTKVLNIDGTLRIDAASKNGKPVSITGLQPGAITDSVITINPVTGELRRLSLNEVIGVANVGFTNSSGGGGFTITSGYRNFNIFFNWSATVTAFDFALPTTGMILGDKINIFAKGNGTSATGITFSGGSRDGTYPTTLNKSDHVAVVYDGSAWLITKNN